METHEFGLVSVVESDSEPSPIGLNGPIERAISQHATGGIQQGFSLMPTPLAVQVAADCVQLETDLYILKTTQGIAGPGTALDLGARRMSWFICLLASLDGRHDEGGWWRWMR